MNLNIYTKQKMKKMSADYEALFIERENLLHLSNKFRAEVHRLQHVGTQRGADITHPTYAF